ncbi:MAG TPA: NAD(P)/FAD-dependent oxidoreductase [Verrucomicrobiae bacterium]|nr:NAD(P)/FAD-dependent oxidoreductase [Verrucomicrobiae bacterium]
MNEPVLPHIVVIGGGFGGLTFCQAFPARRARITLIDRSNHHLFQPLLYQVATAGLSVPDIAQPIRSIISERRDITVLMDEVERIDLANRQVTGKTTTLNYDYLVIAAGARTAYFGHSEWAEHAPGLKSIDDALHIRRGILAALERAEISHDETERARLMTVVVAGGGPTGVELAGAFAELFRNTLADDFRNVDPARGRVILIEAGPRLLPQFPAETAEVGLRQLKELGVEVRLNTRVQDIQDRAVLLGNETIAAETIVWAAGVEANPLTKSLGTPLDRAGRLKVNPDLTLPGQSNVFAIGDLVSLVDPKGQTVPGVAPAAMQMGKYVSTLISHDIEGWAKPNTRDPFVYRDKGSLATIGRSRAVALIAGMQLSGFLAWLAWLVIHLLFLVGLRNKVSVVLSWTYSFFTYNRSSRVIYNGKRED